MWHNLILFEEIINETALWNLAGKEIWIGCLRSWISYFWHISFHKFPKAAVRVNTQGCRSELLSNNFFTIWSPTRWPNGQVWVRFRTRLPTTVHIFSVCAQTQRFSEESDNSIMSTQYRSVTKLKQYSLTFAEMMVGLVVFLLKPVPVFINNNTREDNTWFAGGRPDTHRVFPREVPDLLPIGCLCCTQWCGARRAWTQQERRISDLCDSHFLLSMLHWLPPWMPVYIKASLLCVGDFQER